MLVQEPIQAAIWECLNHYDYYDATFLAERLHAEDVSDETLFLLATCYYRSGDKNKAYNMMRGKVLASPRTKYLMARICVDLDKLSEAEVALTGGNLGKYHCVENIEKDFGEEACFVLQLMGKIYYKSERTDSGAAAYKKSLTLNPFLWLSFQELCNNGQKPDPKSVFNPNNSNISYPPISSSALSSSIGNDLSQPDMCNSSMITPVQSNPIMGNTIVNDLRQFTPENADVIPNFAFVNTKAPVISKPNAHRNLLGMKSSQQHSPASSPTFGMIPLEASPNLDSYYAAAATKITLAPEKIKPAGNFLRKDGNLVPLQPHKPVFCESGNVTQCNLSNKITGGSLLNAPHHVRRSSRIFHSVKENNKSPNRKYTLMKSPTRKMKGNRSSKNANVISKCIVYTDMKEKEVEREKQVEKEKETEEKEVKVELRTFIVTTKENPLKESLAVQKQSVEKLMEIMQDLGTGYLYMSRFELTSALECLSKLPPSQQNSGYVLSLFGKAYLELNEYGKCVKYFKMMRDKEPYRINSMEFYSTALWHMHQEKELSFLSQCLLEKNWFSSIAWQVAGNCLSVQKEHDAAIRFFRRAVQLDKTSAYAYTLLGHEYVVTDDLERGEVAFRNAIRLEPRLYNPWYGLATIYYKQEKYIMSEIHTKKALSLNPNSPVLACHMSVVQNACRKPQRALATLNKALSLYSKNVLCKFHRASLLYNADRFEDALEDLKELQELIPRESAVFYLMGKIYKKLDNPTLALKYFSWATDLDPKGANAVRDPGDPLTNNSFISPQNLVSGVLSPSRMDSVNQAADAATNALNSQPALLNGDMIDLDELLQ